MDREGESRKPLLNFEAVLLDVETTGTVPEFDRIVEIGIGEIQPNFLGVAHPRTWRVKPGINIPPEASAVNGITDKHVRDCPPFAAIADQVHELLDGKVLVGWNLARFDLPILRHEFVRVGRTFEPSEILDVQRIYFRLNPRDLGSAYAHYIGGAINEQHSSLGDVAATDAVLRAMVAGDDVAGDLPSLLAAARADEDRYLDDDGKFEWRYGQAAFAFGKHGGRLLKDVALTDSGYLGWMSRQDFSPSTMEIVKDARRGRFPERNAPPEATSESIAKQEI